MNHASVVAPTSAHSARACSASTDDPHLSAYNAAFSDLGLRFRWDRHTLDALDEFKSEIARITAYIERYHAHLHAAYDAEFLAQLILRKKTQYLCEFALTDTPDDTR